MKKFGKKTKLMLGALALIAATTAMINTNAATNTNVYLAVQGGQVTIGATGSFDLGTFPVSSVATGIEKQFTGSDYFFVEDLKGANSGYYTTISSTDLTGTNGTITGGNVAMKVPSTATTLINGTANANVVVSNTLTTYTAINAPVTFIKRDNAANAGKIGKYAAFPFLKITIPAYQSVGTYQGTLTYTIIEN